MTSAAQKCFVYRNRFGELLGSCVYIFPLVLGIHSSNEVREALEKTNKDEFGRYSANDINKCKGLSKILGNYFIDASLVTSTRTVNDGDPL